MAFESKAVVVDSHSPEVGRNAVSTKTEMEEKDKCLPMCLDGFEDWVN